MNVGVLLVEIKFLDTIVDNILLSGKVIFQVRSNFFDNLCQNHLFVKAFFKTLMFLCTVNYKIGRKFCVNNFS
jgi:hypothetical protein